MPAKVTKFQGGTLTSVIPDVIEEIHRYAYDLTEFVLAGVESHASAAAPIGPTGNLANSQTHDTRKAAFGAEGEAVSGAEYSAYVNFGTGQRGASSEVPLRTAEIQYSAGWMGMAARPFFSQAVSDMTLEWDKGWRALERVLPRL